MIRRLVAIALLAAACPALAWPASAGQSLIPTPYPSAVGGGQPLNPEPVEHGAPQDLMRDPYPKAMGEDSQGNPPIARTRRPQRRLPTVNERKYRVDRH